MNSITECGTILTSKSGIGRKQHMLCLSMALALVLARTASAQSYRVLKNFSGNDGEHPWAGLVLAGRTLYGATEIGGNTTYGVVFKVNTDGSGYTVLKNFTGGDGSGPCGDLVLTGNTLYGTTDYGGLGYGVVFKVNTDGSGFAVLKNFTGSDGRNPVAGLVLAGGTLYGVTTEGGDSGNGVIFRVNTDGSGYTVLKNFTGGDGSWPFAGLVLAGSMLYGSTRSGGSWYYGTVFKINIDGARYEVLKDFTPNDCREPTARLVLAGGTLYGTTQGGGSSDGGAVFKVNTDGTGFALLKSFSGDDGAYPSGGMVLAGSTLYGTTSWGGCSNAGTIFQVNTDGSGFAVLKDFTIRDGFGPSGNLLLANSTLYGAKVEGGTSVGDTSSGDGVVFSLAGLPIAPPSITAPPLSQTTEIGTTPSFSVGVTNTLPEGTYYRWYFNSTNALASATNNFLRLINVQPVQSGAYTVVVTNALGAVTSSPAMLGVIAPVPRRTVPALTLTGQAGTYVNLDFRIAIDSFATWETFETVQLTNASQKYFELTAPPAAQRFYRAWQTNVLSPPSIQDVHLVPAITLTGALGNSVRLDYINQFGPIDAWVALDTITLTSSPQLYFDISVIGQPARLYRVVSLP